MAGIEYNRWPVLNNSNHEKIKPEWVNSETYTNFIIE